MEKSGSDSIVKSTPWFYERTTQLMNTTAIDFRRLQIFNGDDYIMIKDLLAKDGPTRITMCTF